MSEPLLGTSKSGDGDTAAVAETVRPLWKRKVGGSLCGTALRGAAAAASLNVVKRRTCVANILVRMPLIDCAVHATPHAESALLP